LGFTPRTAATLERANLRTVEDLKSLTGDQLLAIPGIGSRELRRCENLLGVPLPKKTDYWTAKGISSRTAQFLLWAGIEDLEILARTTREDFLRTDGLAFRSLQECEKALGRRLASPEDDWMLAGCRRRTLARKLSRAAIFNFNDLRLRTEEDLLSLGLDRREVEECHRLVGKGTAGEAPNGKP
jgi:DNA-directed RNA polymerase alpha subunit